MLYMVNCCGIGFDSHLTQRVNLQKNRGKRNKSIYAASLIHTDDNYILRIGIHIDSNIFKYICGYTNTPENA